MVRIRSRTSRSRIIQVTVTLSHSITSTSQTGQLPLIARRMQTTQLCREEALLQATSIMHFHSMGRRRLHQLRIRLQILCRRQIRLRHGRSFRRLSRWGATLNDRELSIRGIISSTLIMKQESLPMNWQMPRHPDGRSRRGTTSMEVGI